jgi:class 3 adenylate cyclase/CHASE2 domain-containing sensor protein
MPAMREFIDPARGAASLNDQSAAISPGRARPRAPVAPIAALAGCLLAALLAQGTTLVERIDEAAFDVQVRCARLLSLPGANDAALVVVGIDEDSLDALGVPMAMMHVALGRALESIAAAGPRVVGLDLALPDRSFDTAAPGIDLALIRGLHAARSAAALVLAADVDGAGHLRPPYLPLLAAAGGAQALGLPLFPLDCDATVRRFDPDPASAPDTVSCATSAAARAAAGAGEAPAPVMPTFVARIAQQLGRGRLLAQAGWIDFAPFDYVPLRSVLAWTDAGDRARLQQRFGGRIVLLGSVLPFLDRLRLPVALAAWEPRQFAPPGVIVNAQLLRNALGEGLVHTAPWPIARLADLSLVAVAVIGALMTRARRLVLALAAGFVAALAAHLEGVFYPPGLGLIAAAGAFGTRAAIDLAGARAERAGLLRRLSGYLSPRLLDALAEGRVQEEGTRRRVALLFADLRGFTAWSESADPVQVREVLNRYYALITPLLHRHGGTIDNFRGDGVMVMFGAPDALDEPCDAALAAARAIIAAVENFAPASSNSGAPGSIAVAIGLAYGEVVFGALGSSERRDFTALGDAVNVAARLQDLVKELGATVLMTKEFARQLPPGQPGLQDMGVHELKGHSPVAVIAWQPPLPGAAPA